MAVKLSALRNLVTPDVHVEMVQPVFLLQCHVSYDVITARSLRRQKQLQRDSYCWLAPNSKIISLTVVPESCSEMAQSAHYFPFATIQDGFRCTFMEIFNEKSEYGKLNLN
jgi:hypothetical protein